MGNPPVRRQPQQPLVEHEGRPHQQYGADDVDDFHNGVEPDRAFRTSRTRYRAKRAVGLFEGELFHLTHEALEALVVADPLLA